MTVFVIPLGGDRYELYFEQAADVPPPDEPVSTGWLARLQRQFAQLLRAAETRHERRAVRAPDPQGWGARLQDRLLSWIAERIAEQRLLWNLRQQTAVTAVHPDDLGAEAALAHIRRVLRREFERHRFWLIIDAVGLIVSAAFTVIPGPNLIAYYFVFRVGGHWLSLRGASKGLAGVEWRAEPSRALLDLRRALEESSDQRTERVRAVAAALELRDLSAFLERQRVRVTPGGSDAGGDPGAPR